MGVGVDMAEYVTTAVDGYPVAVEDGMGVLAV